MKLALGSLLVFTLVSCANTVMVKVAPRMELDREHTLGIVTFDAEGKDVDGGDVTRRFLEAIHEGQPGTAILELGTSAEVLAAVGKTRLDGEAAREIGEKFGVEAVLVGTVSLVESKPKVDVSLDKGFQLGSVQAQVRLDGKLEVKLLNAERGASLWSGSSSRWIQLACVGASRVGFASVDVEDREQQIERLLFDMVQEASADFRPTWVRQPAP